MFTITTKTNPSDLGKTETLTTKSLKVAKDKAYKAVTGTEGTVSVEHKGKLVGTWVHREGKGWEWSHE